MDAEIINVGTELLIGDLISNTQQFLVNELANIDVNICCTNSCGIDRQRLRTLLGMALSRSDVILIVGGMGPNKEDITKETVCEALGLTLVPHDISRNRIQEYCNNNGITITDTIMSMADMPAGSVVFRNDSGMCPGCAIRSAKQCIVMLPSSTVEMRPMVKNYVSQYLKQLADGAVFSQVINVFYLGVSLHEVEERLGHLLNSSNPTIKCVEMTGEVHIRVTAKTASEQVSREMAAPVIKQIIEIFGDDAYGMNTIGIEEVVVRELKDRKMTLSTAESCTAGIISKRVTDIPGASRVFELGAATYSSNKKSDMLGVSDKIIQRYGAVSPEAAAAMAVGARRLAGSTLAVSTTGIAGPGGGTALKPVGLVYIALADKENVWIRKTLIQKPGMDRDYVRQVAASHALNMVRLYVNSLPYLMPGYEPLGEGVKESYFSDAGAMSPQAMKQLAASVPVASIGTSHPDLQSSVPDASRNAPHTQISSAQYNEETLFAEKAKQGSKKKGKKDKVEEPDKKQKKDDKEDNVRYPQDRYYSSAPPRRGRGRQQGYPQQRYAQQGYQQGYPQQGYGRGRQQGYPQQRRKATGRDVSQRIVFMLALVVMLCSGGYLLYNLVILPYMVEKSFDSFRDAHETQTVISANNGVWSGGEIEQDPDRNADGTLKSFTSLLELNKDIIGWITVPNTVIDYPVMLYPDDGEYQRQHGEYYYLHKNIYGEYDKNGTVFAYYPCHFAVNELSKNTILFGHHMKSGIMFQNLLKYDVRQKTTNIEFYKQNPVIRFDTKYNEYQWVIFAVVKADAATHTKDTFRWIRSDFENDEDYANFIADIRARSLIDTSSCIDVNAGDYILTLQTCSYEADEMRTLIVARRLRDGETSIDVSSAKIASNPIMPAVMGG